MKDHSERSHSLLGGSGAHIWANCTGSVFYKKSLPILPPEPHMLEGTMAHEIAENVLKCFLEHKIDGVTRPLWVVDTEGPASDSDSLEKMVQAAHDYKDAIWKQVLEETLTGKAYGIEETFVLKENLDMYGTVDFWCVYIDDHGKRTGVVVDYKYGFLEVEAEKNAQLAYYALGLREEIRRSGKDLDHVRAVIYQPRVLSGEVFKDTWFTGKQLDVWHNKFLKAAHSILVEQKPKFKVGSWCTFCQAKGICETYKDSITTDTDLALVDIGEITLPEPQTLSNEALINFIRHEDKIKSFLLAVKKYVTGKMVNGHPFSGLKLVASKTRTMWKKDADYKVLIEHGITDPCQAKLRSISSIKKDLTKLVGGQQATDILQSLCTQSSSSICLVEESDPREPVSNPLDLLGNDEQEE